MDVPVYSLTVAVAVLALYGIPWEGRFSQLRDNRELNLNWRPGFIGTS